jgi:hypothetical protein
MFPKDNFITPFLQLINALEVARMDFLVLSHEKKVKVE